MSEYTEYSLDELQALHRAKKKSIKKLRRHSAACSEKIMKTLLAERECLKRLIHARGGKTSGMTAGVETPLHTPGVVEPPEKRVATLVTSVTRTKPPPAKSSESPFSDADADAAQTTRLVATG